MAFINYAHRGASEYYPENTLYSFYAGLSMGAGGIETDIQRTRDGHLVLFHDDTMERITGDQRRISDCSLHELLQMDFGRYKGQRFQGERIVLLDTFLTHFSRRGLKLALEIKQPGVEEASLAAVNEHECRDEVTFTSFLWDSVLAVRRLDAGIPIGFLTNEISEDVLTRLQEARIFQICPRVDLVNEESMRLALERGFSVRFWGVKDEADMRRAVALGGDGTTCNFPDKLAALLRQGCLPM